MTINLDNLAATAVSRIERQADLDAQSETRQLTTDEIMRAAQAREIDLSYRPSKPADIRAGIDGSERRAWTISLGRLYVDCGRAAARYAPRYRGDLAETLQSDAMRLILAWPTQGGGKRADGTRTTVIDLGGRLPLKLAKARAMAEPTRARGVTRWMAEADRILTAGTLPRRADWILSDDAPRDISPLAWRALHAAVKQAAAMRAFQAAVTQSEAETPTEAIDLDAAVEAERQAAGDDAATIPDVDAPETLARMMDLPLDAARAMVAQSYAAVSTAALAEDWGISAQAAANALTRGRSALRKRYPRAEDLLSAIDRAQAYWTVARAGEAAVTLAAFRDGDASETAARAAVNDWRASTAAMNPQRVALLAACRAAILRHGGQYGSDLAAQTARQVTDHMRILSRHATRRAAVGNVGTSRTLGDTATETAARMRGQLRSAFRVSEAEGTAARRVTRWIAEAEARLAGAEVTAATRAARIWSYGLEAATQRETLTPAAMAEAETATDGRRQARDDVRRARQAARDAAAIRKAEAATEAWWEAEARRRAARECHCDACVAA